MIICHSLLIQCLFVTCYASFCNILSACVLQQVQVNMDIQMQIIHEETQIKEMTSEIDKLNAKISNKRARIAKKKSQLQIEGDGQTPIRERILSEY